MTQEVPKSPDGKHWWDEWVLHHATLFGKQSNQDALAMLSLLREVVIPAGYSRVELFAASNWIAINNPPKFLGDHLPALLARLRENRREARSVEKGRWEDRWGTCGDCYNSGVVIVPHPRSIIDGEWVRLVTGGPYSCAVRCICLNGRRMSGDMLSLADYAEKFPDWQLMVARYKETQARENALLARSKTHKAFSQVIEKAKEAMR